MGKALPTVEHIHKVVVTLEDGDKGLLHVYSKDVPGLHLCGVRQDVWPNVAPMIKTMLIANKKLDVLKVWLPSEAPEGDSPRDVHAAMHVSGDAAATPGTSERPRPKHTVDFLVQLAH